MSNEEEWVTLDLKLLNWRYMNHRKTVRTSAHVFTLKQLLRERHGIMTQLVICHSSFTEANEMVNEMQTLAQYGIKGRRSDEVSVLAASYVR